jgi:hypothetical protein
MLQDAGALQSGGDVACDGGDDGVFEGLRSWGRPSSGTPGTPVASTIGAHVTDMMSSSR